MGFQSSDLRLGGEVLADVVSQVCGDGLGVKAFLVPGRRDWKKDRNHTGRRLSRAYCAAPRPSWLSSRGNFGSAVGS